MTNQPMTIEEMYGDWGITRAERDAALDRSRNPRDNDSLYQTFEALGLGEGAVVLDIGARDARHALRLAERFGCRVVAVEPVADNVDKARAAIADHANSSLVEVRQGGIEGIPAGDGEFDAVWSRDMLVHVADIDTAMGECHRVLGPGGAMVLHQTFATDRLEPNEAQRIYADLAIVPERMAVAGFEAAATRAGFTIEDVDVVASEWREAWEEDGSGRTSAQLMHAARMLRCRDELLTELGEVGYRVELANALWGVYQMIGKLEPRVYVLRALAAQRPARS